MKSWQNQNVTVMGLGHHDGGMAVLKYLCQQGAHVTLTELKPRSEFQDSLSELESLGLAGIHFGGHAEEHFLNADCVIISPAVPPRNRWRTFCSAQNIPVGSEIELFWNAFPGKTVCVTGTVGKSTIVTVLHRMLYEAGFDALLGGNIGRSLLSDLDSCGPETIAVLEISSFQAWQLASHKPRPDVTIISNLSPNHLDWHEDFEHYTNAKLELIQHQTDGQFLISDLQEEALNNLKTDAERLFLTHQPISQSLPVASHLLWEENASEQIVWNHGDSRTSKLISLPAELQSLSRSQRQDYGLALCASFVLDVPVETGFEVLVNFEGLPHRCEKVESSLEFQFINDSKSTTIAASLSAVERFSHSPLTVLIGGLNKGVDLMPLFEQASRQAQWVIIYGDCVNSLSSGSLPQSEQCQFLLCEALPEAVDLACEKSEPGATILLSPACSSFDQFQSFEHRGEVFRELVRAKTGPETIQSTSRTMP